MRASVALPSVSGLATDWVIRAARVVERRRWPLIGLCIVGNWAFLWHEALGQITHNGWLYADGDDGPWYWTTAWGLRGLHVPYAAIGAGWPYLMAPLAAAFGPNMADGLPAVIGLNVLVLGPASVIGMYLIGERIAGRIFGVWCSALWTLMPTLALALYSASHRSYVVNYFLPTGLGLNTLSDYPSMVCAIFCAYLVIRAMDSNALLDGVMAGSLLGFLVLIKPANGPLAVVAVIALLVRFRWRALAGTLASAVPAAVALFVWKKTGLGAVPAFSGGGGGGQGGVTAVTQNSHRYLNIDFHHLSQNLHALSEVFWSVRLLEFLFIVGGASLIARGRWKGTFVVGWFVGFALIKGTVGYSNIFDASLYRFLLPAWPAWTLIVASVVLWWPVGAERRARQHDEDVARPGTLRATSRWIVVALGLVFTVVPLVLVLAISRSPRGSVVNENYVGAPIPVVEFDLKAVRTGPHTVRFRWDAKATRRARTTYAIFKGADDGCGPPQQTCPFKMVLIGTTHTNSFSDTQAVTRRFYRVGLAEGGLVQVDNPSLLLMSRPVVVAAP